MYLSRLARLVALLAGVLSGSNSTAAQDWAFAGDEHSKEVRQSDSIVVVLTTSRLPIKDNFLASAKRVGAILQVTVSGTATKSGGVAVTEQNAVFPFGFRTSVPQPHAGLVNLPFQGTPVKGLKLYNSTSEGTTEYKNLAFEITMVELDEPSLWTKILQRLIGVGQTAVVPALPFGGIAKYALDFANGTINDVLQDSEAGKEKTIPLGVRALNFKTYPAVKTGVHLLILPEYSMDEHNKPIKVGHVDPNDLRDVCLYRNLGAGETIVVGWKKPGATDLDEQKCSKSTYTSLTNPYVPILLETEVPAARMTKAELDGIMEGKISHCAFAGISPAECRDLLVRLTD